MHRFLIMGVVNVTPDSFSDGGLYLDPQAALNHARHLIEHGADIIDVGAESTRPGAKPVTDAEEWRRLEPVVRVISKWDVNLSIDTYKPQIMRRAVDLGVTYVNDIRGATFASDDDLIELARSRVNYIAMHSSEGPETMQNEPMDAKTAVASVDHFFKTSRARFERLGFTRDKIWLDPGIGFGKDDRANLSLLARLKNQAPEFNLAVGVSRKSFIGRILDINDAAQRDPASKMLELGLAICGVKIIRTHDVRSLAKIRALLSNEA